MTLVFAGCRIESENGLLPTFRPFTQRARERGWRVAEGREEGWQRTARGSSEKRKKKGKIKRRRRKEKSVEKGKKQDAGRQAAVPLSAATRRKRVFCGETPSVR